MSNETPQPMFEVPNTAKSLAFVTRNPQFPDALLKLNDTANKCFGRDPHTKNHLEYICFWLGHTCRQDFLEVVFLAMNGYAAGATKILRSLYERAVTIEYLIQNPQQPIALNRGRRDAQNNAEGDRMAVFKKPLPGLVGKLLIL